MPDDSGPAPSLPAARLLLVGGGHAHVEVLRRFGLERPRGMAPLLVSPSPVHLYSGMVTGYVAGEYELEELTLPLERLARWAGAGFVRGRVARADARRSEVELEDGRRLGYDVVSFDVGSAVKGLDEVPGAATRAITVRPVDGIETLTGALDDTETRRVLVVGGGAAGVELAFCAAARLARRGRGAAVELAERAPRVLPELDRRAGAAATRLLADHGIRLRCGAEVMEVEEEAVRAGRERTPFDVLVWAAGPSAPSLFRDSGLPVDSAGYLRVGPSLASPDFPDVYGAGDCVSLAGLPNLPRAGVYAVREGPVLWRALRARISGSRPPRYVPQPRALYAINTGDGKAMVGRGAYLGHGRWARWLKEAIDRRFMRRYLEPPGEEPA